MENKEFRTIVGEGLGFLLFFVPSLLIHMFWSVWGLWAYPLALILGFENGHSKKDVMSYHATVVGNSYVSSRLFPSWNYYGAEPEAPGYIDLNHLSGITFNAEWLHCNVRGDEDLDIPHEYDSE